MAKVKAGGLFTSQTSTLSNYDQESRLYTARILHAHRMRTACTLRAHRMPTVCPLHAHCMPTECPLNAH